MNIFNNAIPIIFGLASCILPNGNVCHWGGDAGGFSGDAGGYDGSYGVIGDAALGSMFAGGGGGGGGVVIRIII